MVSCVVYRKAHRQKNELCNYNYDEDYVIYRKFLLL